MRDGRSPVAPRRHLRVVAVLLLASACKAPRAHGLSPPEQPQPHLHAPLNLGIGTMKEEWRGEVVHLSWKPRAYLWKHFLSDEECDHLVSLSRPKLTASHVADSVTGKSVPHQGRTSTGTFYQRGHDAVISRIEERVALATMLPVENQEGLQILHYEGGQKYEPHMDWFHEAHNTDVWHGGQRYLTVLMYLATPEEGGETVFPAAEFKSTGPGLSDCARRGLANRPVKGDALVFYSLTPDGKEDPMSLHGSCPTTKGEKWSATKWIHVGPYGGSAAEQKAKWGDCVDANPSCKDWAGQGECGTNPGYMLAYCRQSCGKCAPKGPVIEVGGPNHGKPVAGS